MPRAVPRPTRAPGLWEGVRPRLGLRFFFPRTHRGWLGPNKPNKRTPVIDRGLTEVLTSPNKDNLGGMIPITEFCRSYVVISMAQFRHALVMVNQLLR